MKFAKGLLLLSIGILLVGCSATESVIIDAPQEKVWNYVSDSSKAEVWSIYFDHITALPGIKDGEVGSTRRCFRRKDETGMFWDEDVMAVNPPNYREIRTYNIHGLPVPKMNEVEYKVEQILEPISPTQTKLTFKCTVRKGMDLLALWYLLRDGAESKRILYYNLENIKSQIESDGQKPPPHPYEEKTKWD